MAEKSEIKALARIYELLAEFSDAELLAAAGIDGLPMHVANALLALAVAREDLSKMSARKRKSKPEHKVVGQRRTNLASKPNSDGRERRAASLLGRAVLDRHVFRSTQDLEKFLRQNNVSLAVQPKDSRSRILVRVRRVVENLSQSEKERFFMGLEQLMDSRQTSGWFSVIRSGRK